ncbi:hypothetical protein LWI29_021366 [Acer saccharum]|uniref:DNA-directed RNA polymerase n=1 Tax=Acer saccharum TaxID=4024 RepID=A0AA39W2U8_ACESA|nr:hypothetical protein LWI29_021366 [Acer saccharum]
MQVDGHDVEHKQQRDGSFKSTVDKYQLLPEFLKVRGLVKQHLESFNYFVNTDIKKIVLVNDRLVSAVDPRIYIRFTDVRIGQPSVIGVGIKKKSTTPQMCRLSGMTYFAPILVNIEYTTLVKQINTALGEEIVTLEKENFVIGEIPIMLRSRCCVLYGKNEAELARLGECPLDPGGYFIIKGTEKVLLIQEHLSKNRIIVDTDKKSKINVSVTSNTELVKSKTVIQMEKGKVYLILNQFVKKIPIMVVLKAMGMESDQEVVQMLGRDPRFSALLLPSIEECASLDIYTQERASEYIEGKVKTFTFGSPSSNQWGMLCPCDTPEGEACGLVKNLALMTHVTTDEEGAPLISLCYSLGVEDLELLSVEELHTPNSFLVVFNGLILGKHRRPQHFTNGLRKLRRAGKIGEFVSIFVHEKQRCVYIASDGGRVCRPLVIADKGISRIKEHHMKELSDGDRTFDDFLCDGLIEYLDVNEENNALIALYEGEATPDTTHIEIEPFTILGVCAGLIPYPHHNQSPRNTYQLSRMDTLLYLLVYPQRPLLTTRTIELVGYDKLGAGQNATVAVMSYSGYDIEDAIVMNKSSLDRGFGRCIVMKKESAVYRKVYESGASDRILIKPDRTGPDAEKMRILDDDGIATPGEIIRPKDIYLIKESPLVTGGPALSADELRNCRYRPTKSTYKGSEGETCVVDRVALCADKGNSCIKLIIRQTRRPEVGDKFSSRHGQKGVCGTIIQQEDFPFSESGICPDLIMNPHGFPSRMTVGKMIELLGGKAGVSCGRFHYGSAFGEPSGHADRVEAISDTLVKHGFSYSGKDFIYSGITGSPLEAYIFMGPIYYQKLKHMVQDKMHARGSGPRAMLTRQPTEGKARNGGLRVGEMERNCLIAYGASMLICERMMQSSDAYEVQVCRVCGLMGYYNHKLKVGMCSTCKNGDNVSTMKLPYACKLLFQELQSMNIVPRLKLAEA